jgi:hypothetical protein
MVSALAVVFVATEGFELATDVVEVPAQVPRRQHQGRAQLAAFDVAGQGPARDPEHLRGLGGGEQLGHTGTVSAELTHSGQSVSTDEYCAIGWYDVTGAIILSVMPWSE